MRIIKDYKTFQDREQIITEMKAKRYNLIEDQIYTDGKHLVFVDAPRDLATEIDNLKARIEKLEKK